MADEFEELTTPIIANADALLMRVKQLENVVAQLDVRLSELLHKQLDDATSSTEWKNDPNSLGNVAGTIAEKMPSIRAKSGH